MRVSSVIVFPSSGTLRSQRTRTRLPARSAVLRSLTDFLVAAVAAAIEIVAGRAAGADTRRVGATKVDAELAGAERAGMRDAARRTGVEGTKPVTILDWMC